MTIIKGRICLQCMQIMVCDCKPEEAYWVDADIPIEDIKNARRIFFDKDFGIMPKTTPLAIKIANLRLGDETFSRKEKK